MKLCISAIALGLGISFLAPASPALADGIYYQHKVRVHKMHVRKVAYERCDLVRWHAVLTRDGFRWRRVHVCEAFL